MILSISLIFNGFIDFDDLINIYWSFIIILLIWFFVILPSAHAKIDETYIFQGICIKSEAQNIEEMLFGSGLHINAFSTHSITQHSKNIQHSTTKITQHSKNTCKSVQNILHSNIDDHSTAKKHSKNVQYSTECATLVRMCSVREQCCFR